MPVSEDKGSDTNISQRKTPTRCAPKKVTGRMNTGPGQGPEALSQDTTANPAKDCSALGVKQASHELASMVGDSPPHQESNLTGTLLAQDGWAGCPAACLPHRAN